MQSEAEKTFFENFTEDFLYGEFVITSSKNPLIEKGDVLDFFVGEGEYEGPGEIIFARIEKTWELLYWKFASVYELYHKTDFDNFDWRNELDDKVNLAAWNFFHLESFKEFLGQITFERFKNPLPEKRAKDILRSL